MDVDHPVCITVVLILIRTKSLIDNTLICVLCND